nr:COL3 [Tamarix hispida]
MTPNRKIASAVGAKTARACDNCVQKRARWYCEADDAFLCQACDGSVHSANQLARRHERVRLKTASLKPPIDHKPSTATSSSPPPSWHRGFFTRKARTPRHGKQRHLAATAESDDTARYLLPFRVPELGSYDSASDHDENDQEQLLYRVPLYDPFVAEFCTSTPSNELAYVPIDTGKVDQTKEALMSPHDEVIRDCCGDINCFVPSEMDLAEFAADVETLLGKGLDQETHTLEELGLLDDDQEENHATIFQDYSMSNAYGGRGVTAEGEGSMEAIKPPCSAETENDVIIREPFQLNFEYDSPTTREEEDAKATVGQVNSISREKDTCGHEKKGKAISLRLDYEAILAAWAGQGSPWMDGERPDIMNPDNCWHLGLGTSGTEVNVRPPYGSTGIIGGGEQPSIEGGGREARVLRYREKRRTRLFSKKIRYEVRKLNAEKRPRMKGRFVKRSSLTPTGFPILGKLTVSNS